MLWAGDTRTRLIANIQAHGKDCALISITAPSMGWDRSKCRHPPDEKCAGPRGCTVVRSERYRWNRSAPDRWRRLHRLAAQRVRRRGYRFSVLAREWEYQARGVLHMHVVVSLATARDIAAAHHYVQELDKLRGDHDFGYVDRGKRGAGRKRSLEVIQPGRAAAYLAKYLAPVGESNKLTLTDTVRQPDVPALVVYVARHLTGETRVTMRTLRIRRAAHVIARKRGEPFYPVLQELLGERPTWQLLVGQHVDEARGP